MDDHLPRPLIKNIAFFGDAAVPKTDPVYKDAFEIAKLLAKEGYTIVNGGGPGVMDASTQGAEEAGGGCSAGTDGSCRVVRRAVRQYGAVLPAPDRGRRQEELHGDGGTNQPRQLPHGIGVYKRLSFVVFLLRHGQQFPISRVLVPV